MLSPLRNKSSCAVHWLVHYLQYGVGWAIPFFASALPTVGSVLLRLTSVTSGLCNRCRGVSRHSRPSRPQVCQILVTRLRSTSNNFSARLHKSQDSSPYYPDGIRYLPTYFIQLGESQLDRHHHDRPRAIALLAVGAECTS